MAWQKILGIDPGSRICGYAVIESDGRAFRYVTSGHIRLEKLELPQRLGRIFSQLIQVIEEHQPDTSSVEGIFMSNNARSALLLGQARGSAICALVNSGLEVAEYSAKVVKKAVTGNGNADKQQVCFMVCRLLQIAERNHKDETDAMAVALCHALHNQAVYKKAVM